MANPAIVYAIHIAAPPERVWEALTQDEFIQQYWEGAWRVETDWRAGSPIKFFMGDGAFYSQGEIVVADPPRTLAYTWPEQPEKQSDRPPELLTWQITPSGPGVTKLQLTHENVSDEYFAGVGEGWPQILSSLKSLLELGRTLTFHREKQA